MRRLHQARAHGDDRPRLATPGLDFYDRNGSSHSGEFTDAKRHFFVLEPAHPPEPPPDMDAIRAEIEARNAAANSMHATQSASTNLGHPSIATELNPKSDLARFKASMEIDYERWHDGIGYDLSILKEASPMNSGPSRDVSSNGDPMTGATSRRWRTQ